MVTTTNIEFVGEVKGTMKGDGVMQRGEVENGSE